MRRLSVTLSRGASLQHRRVLVRRQSASAGRRVTFLSNSFADFQLTNGAVHPQTARLLSTTCTKRAHKQGLHTHVVTLNELTRRRSLRLPCRTPNLSTPSHQEEDDGTVIHVDLLTADVYNPANGGETTLLLSESLSLLKVCNARRTRKSGCAGAPVHLPVKELVLPFK